MSGGKKKRTDIQTGLDQANMATQQGVAAFQPFATGGLPAFNQANAFLGLGTPQQNAAARTQFEASPFFTGGQNAFGIEKDEIDAGLSNSGLLFSQSRQNAVADARQRNYQNALAQFLGLNSQQAGFGLQGAAGQAGLFNQQGQNAFAAGQAKANTRQGFLGTLGQISQIANNFGSAVGGTGGFSDRKLKRDVRPISSHGPLTVYRWTWNDEAKALGLSGDEVGFMADEVEKIMPEAVGSSNGYQTVNYGAVMERFD